MSRKEFYKIIPQMKDYDRLGFNWLPYIMFTQTRNFRSASVNTDQLGFRYNDDKSMNKKYVLNDENIDLEKNLVCGGSFGFGTGSTKDENTISAIMSKKGELTLNFSGSAFVDFQNIITLISNLNSFKAVKKIIIFTGLSDLYFSKKFGNTYPDSMFFASTFFEAMDNQVLSKKKRIFRSIINFFSPNSINSESIKKINKQNFLNYFISKNFRKNLNKTEPFSPVVFEKKLQRNFAIYQMISKYLNAEIEIYLSPYIFWSKELSSEEKKLVENTKKFYSKEIRTIYSVLDDESYEFLIKILAKQCSKFEFNFCDINKFFKDNFLSKNWLFVDSVHSTDFGYREVSNMILNK